MEFCISFQSTFRWCFASRPGVLLDGVLNLVPMSIHRRNFYSSWKEKNPFLNCEIALWVRKPGELPQGKLILVGLEPTIPGSVGRCLIHWATGPLQSWLSGKLSVLFLRGRSHLVWRWACLSWLHHAKSFACRSASRDPLIDLLLISFASLLFLRQRSSSWKYSQLGT